MGTRGTQFTGPRGTIANILGACGTQFAQGSRGTSAEILDSRGTKFNSMATRLDDYALTGFHRTQEQSTPSSRPNVRFQTVVADMAMDRDVPADMAANMAALEQYPDDNAFDDSRSDHVSPVQSRSTLKSCGRFQNARVDMTATTCPHRQPPRDGQPCYRRSRPGSIQ